MCMYVHVHVHVCVCAYVCVCIVEGSVGSEVVKSCESHRYSQVKSCESARVSAETVSGGSVVVVGVGGNLWEG